MQESCPQCSVKVGSPDWLARRHVRWANQYGRSERIFCDYCGAWTDCRFWGDNRVVYTVVKGHKPDMQKVISGIPF